MTGPRKGHGSPLRLSLFLLAVAVMIATWLIMYLLEHCRPDSGLFL